VNFGFRYHVASLIAVFFALILGILIGGALFPDHALVDEQANLLSDLEERFRESQASLAKVQSELDASNQEWRHVLDTVSKDMLRERTIALVGMDWNKAPLIELLETAGAEVVEVEWEHLSKAEPSDDQVFIFPLEDTISGERAMVLNVLSSSGANLAFVWDSKSRPVLTTLPMGLMVDSIDTSLGKLALIIGLARGSVGHYGREKGAVGLLP